MMDTSQQQLNNMFIPEQYGEQYQAPCMLFQTRPHQDYMGNDTPTPDQELPDLGNDLEDILGPEPQSCRYCEHLQLTQSYDCTVMEEPFQKHPQENYTGNGSPTPSQIPPVLSNGVDGMPQLKPCVSLDTMVSAQLNAAVTMYFPDDTGEIDQSKGWNETHLGKDDLRTGVPINIDNADHLKCHQCNKQFGKQCYLRQHINAAHSGDKLFRCEKCGKRFSTEFQRNEHVQKHNGNKPHKCKQCSRQFHYKSDLQRHMSRHTGILPYKCPICGKGFNRNDHMVKHCKTHRNKNERD